MKAKKIISLALCAVMLVALSVAGTLAYLTDDDSVKNTFTVGNVQIDLWETDLTPSASDDANTVTHEGNAYKLIPGMTYTKDPTVKVLDGSEDCWVRMLVTVSNIEDLKAAMPKDDPDFANFYAGDLFLLQNLTVNETGALTWDGTKWLYEEGTGLNGVYEFRYHKIVSAGEDIPALFTDITVPGAVTETQLLNLDGIEISVVAHAIQAAGFEDDMDGAWIAFGQQNP